MEVDNTICTACKKQKPFVFRIVSQCRGGVVEENLCPECLLFNVEANRKEMRDWLERLDRDLTVLRKLEDEYIRSVKR